MDNKVTIYGKSGSVLLKIDVNDNSYRYRAIMSTHTVTLYYSLAEHVEIPVGSYIIYQAARYTLWAPENFKKHSTRNFEYTVEFGDNTELLKLYKYKDLSEIPYRVKFPLTAKPATFLKLLVDNMNLRDSGWRVGACIDASEKALSFSHEYCYDVLGRFASEWGTEWEIEDKTINLRKVEKFKSSPLPLSYGKGNGIKPGTGRANQGDKKPVSLLYVQGGERNIDYSKYKSKSLLLPKSQELEYEGRCYVTDEHGMYIMRVDRVTDTIVEDSYDASDIYPSRVGEISEVVPVEEEKNFYDIIDNSIPEELNFEDCLIAGETMTIIFQTGMLVGREFEVKYIHEAKSGKKARRFEIVPAELDGIMMPNPTFFPKSGDKYAVFNINLPDAYVCNNSNKTGASWDMFRDAVRYFYEHEEAEFSFSGTLDGIWAKKKWLEIGGRLVPGAYIRFSDTQFQPDGIDIRITGVKDYINKPHSPEIELSNTPVAGYVSSDLGKIDSNEVVAEEQYKEALKFSKRRFRDAMETMGMLESAFLNFSNSIDPITVRTMQILVGDESLQFRFVNSMVAPIQVTHSITYDAKTKVLYSSAGIVQHMTLGISSVSSSHKIEEYKFWNVAEYASPPLVDTGSKYYLYAKVSASDKTGTFLLSEKAIKLEQVSGYYHLLVGVLNSEFEEERSFVELYGFTEVLPGRITTDRIVSSDGLNFMDFVNNAFRVGNRNSYLDWNSRQDNKLRIKGTIVQSDSGDESPIGCFRGTYNSSYTYYMGDEVTYKDNVGLSTYRHKNHTPSKGIAPTNENYWMVVARCGVGIANTDVLYAISNSNITIPTAGWQTDAPAWVDGKYIWSKTKVIYTDGSIVYTDAACITGGKGETGNGISSIVEQYYLSSSATSLSGGSWSTSGPTWKDGWYIWTRSVIYYTDGKSITTDAICVTGGKGQTGDDGKNGDYYEYRFAVNGSRTTPPTLTTTDRTPAGWSTSMPTVGSLKYLWFTIAKISGTNNILLQAWSTPVRQTPYDGIDGRNGDTGPTMVYRGIYGSGRVYYGTSKRVDAVKYNGHYYVSRVDAGNGFQNHAPTDTAYWNDFGAEFESIATNLLLAEGANIGDWFMSGGKIVSTLLDGNKITLDASMAQILIESKRISGDYTSGGEWSDFSYPSLWKQYGQSIDNNYVEGYEYIYCRTTGNSRPNTPSGKNVAGFLPDGWTYYSQGVNSTYQYEWMSRRYQKGLYSTIKLNARSGLIEARNDVGVSYMTPGGIFSNWANTDAVSACLGITRKASVVGLGWGNLDKSQWDNENFIAGVYGTASNKGTAPAYGGFFQNLMAAGLFLHMRAIEEKTNSNGDLITGYTYLNSTDSLVIGYARNEQVVYLPNDGVIGRIIFFKQWWTGNMKLLARGGQVIYDDHTVNSYHKVYEGRIAIAIFTIGYVAGVKKEAWLINTIPDLIQD